MNERVHLVLEDGSIFRGERFGADVDMIGEVVFSTNMTGYQEMLTDPSYAGQIVVPTYPLLGNYGINDDDVESKAIQVRGLIVRHHSLDPSHRSSQKTLHQYLGEYQIPGVSGIDTRALTRKLRDQGVMMGAISSDDPESTLIRLRKAPRYDDADYVKMVTISKASAWTPRSSSMRLRVAVLDLGVKYNILRILRAKGCRVKTLPASTSVKEILSDEPDGVLVSPGPGDPSRLDYLMNTMSSLLGRVPIMSICLGHQVFAHALGGKTYKLKFGHRGGNHPVKDLETGRVYVTAQNHGYAVDPDSLSPDVAVTHVNLNDGTVEGLKHRELRAMSIQYHSEASPGPFDNVEMFDRFIGLMAPNI